MRHIIKYSDPTKNGNKRVEIRYIVDIEDPITMAQARRFIKSEFKDDFGRDHIPERGRISIETIQPIGERYFWMQVEKNK